MWHPMKASAVLHGSNLLQIPLASMISNRAELQVLPSPGSHGGILLLISGGQALRKNQSGGKKTLLLFSDLPVTSGDWQWNKQCKWDLIKPSESALSPALSGCIDHGKFSCLRRYRTATRRDLSNAILPLWAVMSCGDRVILRWRRGCPSWS